MMAINALNVHREQNMRKENEHLFQMTDIIISLSRKKALEQSLPLSIRFTAGSIAAQNTVKARLRSLLPILMMELHFPDGKLIAPALMTNAF